MWETRDTTEGKADGLNALEGSSPGDAMAMSIRTPPGSMSRACIQGGSSGTWESQLSPCSGIRLRGPAVKENSWRWGESPASQTSLEKGYKERGELQGIGGG